MTFDEMLEMLDSDCCKFCKYGYECSGFRTLDSKLACDEISIEELFNEDEIIAYFTEKGMINENNKTNEDTI